MLKRTCYAWLPRWFSKHQITKYLETQSSDFKTEGMTSVALRIFKERTALSVNYKYFSQNVIFNEISRIVTSLYEMYSISCINFVIAM